MNLSIRQITVFREVMRSGSISQAAKAVGRTQPAVSTMIATLEQELGITLFYREHGKLTPTPEARFFQEECDDILARLDRTKTTLRGMRSLQDGTLRITCYPAASGIFIPRLLTQFLADKPDVKVALTMRSSDVVEDLIASQQFDIGLAETPALRTSINQTDFELPCVCLVPANDPLVHLDEITPTDLHNRPMAMLFPGHPIYDQTCSAFRDRGADLQTRFELRTFLPGIQFVAAGACFMVCDMITAYSHLLQFPDQTDIRIKPFAPRIRNSISILSPGYSKQPIIATAFLDYLTQELNHMQHVLTKNMFP